ncbi:MAG: hypothetical protein Q8P31_02460 [Bacillota bacterium]|nr:hypothetical protein [Bacillota bacterium]
MEREEAVIGAFVTREEPTRPMREEAAAAGFYVPELYPDRKCPRLQILTVEELLAGKEIQYPRVAPPATYKRAKRQQKGPKQDQGRLVTGGRPMSADDRKFQQQLARRKERVRGLKLSALEAGRLPGPREVKP